MGDGFNRQNLPYDSLSWARMPNRMTPTMGWGDEIYNMWGKGEYSLASSSQDRHASDFQRRFVPNLWCGAVPHPGVFDESRNAISNTSQGAAAATSSILHEH